MYENSKEDKILLASSEDKNHICQNRHMVTHTDFLDLRQQSMVGKHYSQNENVDFYGGYEDAERRICVFRPEYIQQEASEFFKENEEENPLTWISIDKKARSKELTHRDYLGSLLSLGIKREKIGDILVREDGADIIVVKDIANFIILNYSKAGRVELSLKIVPTEEIAIKPQKTKTITDTVASLRLDGILSSAFGISRSKASEAVTKGIVFVNNRQIMKTDLILAAGDKIVIRGKGKAVLTDIGGTSRKGRTYVEIERYL